MQWKVRTGEKRSASLLNGRPEDREEEGEESKT
jgi:hypothetical protein